MLRLWFLVALWPMLAGAAPPPLSPPQRAQLAAAEDGGPRLDDGAWYPLIENASQAEPGDEAGAAVPDYAAIAASPAAHRGERFLIEGTLARAQRVALARSGPWGDAVTEWVVVVRPLTTTPDTEEEVAVVYLVDPDASAAAARVGARVRVSARFYKLWSDRDANGRPTTYMTFVGRAPAAPPPPPGAPRGGPGAAWAVAPLLALMLVAWVVLRRTLRTRPHRGAASEVRRLGTASTAARDAGETDASLPADPAAALGEMHRRDDG